MDTEKLGTPLGKAVIKHTRHKLDAIRFRDDAINKVKKDNYNFGNKRYLSTTLKVRKMNLFEDQTRAIGIEK